MRPAAPDCFVIRREPIILSAICRAWFGLTSKRYRLSKSTGRKKTGSTSQRNVRLHGSRCQIYPGLYHQQGLELSIQVCTGLGTNVKTRELQ